MMLKTFQTLGLSLSLWLVGCNSQVVDDVFIPPRDLASHDIAAPQDFALASDLAAAPDMAAAPSDMLKLMDLGKPANEGGAWSCRQNADCRLYSSFCQSAPCQCFGLPASATDPPCQGGMVSCLRDPCMGKTAVCSNGVCVAQ